METLRGWTLFHIRGVAVKLHISLLFLLLYVVLISLAQFKLVVAASGLSADQISGTPFLWSLIFAVALMLSVLVHELGHVFVAQSKGARVKGVTLMMLGGVSEIEEIPKEPENEFKVAIIGPIISLALGFGLLALRDFGDSANWNFFAYWIGRLNIVLGIFNLLPAYPLDGGRVLRAWMSSRHGHLLGTQKAVRISRIFAWFFGILGVLQFNFLLVIIALLIYFSARSELLMLLSQNFLSKVRAQDLVSETPLLDEEMTLNEAAEMMLKSRSKILPVNSAQPAVLTSDSIAKTPQPNWNTTTVRESMQVLTKSLNADEVLTDVLALNGFLSLGGWPVVKDGKTIGLLRLQDVLEYIQLSNLLETKTPQHSSQFRYSRA